jgi:hypothetical protein
MKVRSPRFKKSSSERTDRRSRARAGAPLRPLGRGAPGMGVCFEVNDPALKGGAWSFWRKAPAFSPWTMALRARLLGAIVSVGPGSRSRYLGERRPPFAERVAAKARSCHVLGLLEGLAATRAGFCEDSIGDSAELAGRPNIPGAEILRGEIRVQGWEIFRRVPISKAGVTMTGFSLRRACRQRKIFA